MPAPAQSASTPPLAEGSGPVVRIEWNLRRNVRSIGFWGPGDDDGSFKHEINIAIAAGTLRVSRRVEEG